MCNFFLTTSSTGIQHRLHSVLPLPAKFRGAIEIVWKTLPECITSLAFLFHSFQPCWWEPSSTTPEPLQLPATSSNKSLIPRCPLLHLDFFSGWPQPFSSGSPAVRDKAFHLLSRDTERFFPAFSTVYFSSECFFPHRVVHLPLPLGFLLFWTVVPFLRSEPKRK